MLYIYIYVFFAFLVILWIFEPFLRAFYHYIFDISRFLKQIEDLLCFLGGRGFGVTSCEMRLRVV